MWQTMTSIYVIIILATTVLAKASTECVFSDAKEGRLYIAAEGQTLCFSLANRVYATNTEITLKKDDKYLIFKVKNQMITLKGQYAQSHSQVMPEISKGGTIDLGKATTSHSGKYTLEIFLSNGTLQNKVTVHLKVQAPVSKPEVSQMCLSPEQSVVCCSAEGDGVEFIWSLDNYILIPTRAESADKPTSKVTNATISLHGQLTGDLACITQNNISREQTVIHLRSCEDSIDPPSVTVTVAVIASVSTLLLLLALFLYIRHLCKSPRPETVEDYAEYEIVYYNVRVTPARERRPYAK